MDEALIAGDPKKTMELKDEHKKEINDLKLAHQNKLRDIWIKHNQDLKGEDEERVEDYEEMKKLWGTIGFQKNKINMDDELHAKYKKDIDKITKKS